MSRGVDLCTARNRNLIKSCKSNIYRPEHDSPNTNNIFVFIYFHSTLAQQQQLLNTVQLLQASLFKAKSSFNVVIYFPYFVFRFVTGGQARYQIGDVVRLNCTSGRSKPAAHLQWFINGEKPEEMLTRQYETIITGREGKFSNSLRKIIPKYTTLSPLFSPTGLESTIVGLEFRVRQRHFRKGDMKLKV